MSATMTLDDFLDVLRRSRLLEGDRLERFLQSTAPGPDALPEHVAERMVASGLLTAFQADQLLRGKWHGFTIGKYRVLDRLGLGGTGLVYLCEHAVVRRPVALKVLPPARSQNPAVIERFYREAHAAGMLDHPNLVKAHDIDQDGGLHFLVMDYVDGASLHELVARGGPLAPPRAAHYIRQAARGLQHAHQNGLIHRDIKPSNILLDRQGVIRVLDLGLARFYEDDTDPLTARYNKDSILGTVDYISPEQALNSHNVDVRSDVYSLGGTFHFLLTGQPPFPGGKASQKLVWRQTRLPQAAHELCPEVPAELSALVLRMLAREPVQRFQTMEEVVEALACWAPGETFPPAEEEMPRVRATQRTRGDIPRAPRSTQARQIRPGDQGGRSTERIPVSGRPTEPAPPHGPADRRERPPPLWSVSRPAVPFAPPRARPARKPGKTWMLVLALVALAVLVLTLRLCLPLP